MERQILVPLDGSRLGEAVLPHSIALARTTASSLVLLHVAEPALSFTSTIWPVLRAPMYLQSPQEQQAQGEAYLADVIREVEAQGGRARALTRSGDPTGQIVRYAESHQGIWLIAMSTHGRGGLGRWLFGSVTEQVLHAATTPLLLCRAQAHQPAEPRPYKTILVPLDGSLFAERALEQAGELALRTGARLLLLSVGPELDDDGVVDAGLVPLWSMADRHAEREQTMSYLEWQAKELVQRGIAAETWLVGGSPADQIVQVAEAQADLIVMATHGRSGVQRLWLGSVAQHVVRRAGVPVMLVRTEELVKRRGTTGRKARQPVPLQAVEG